MHLGFPTWHHGLLRLSVHRHGRLDLGFALPGLSQHEFAELLTLNLPIDLIGKLADVLWEHRLLHQLLAVILLDVAQLLLIWHLSVVDHRLHIVLQLLHNILILQGSNIHIFALNVSIKERALLRWVAVFESLVPAETLELEVEVEDEERVCKVDVGVAPIVSSLEVHRQIKVVESVRMPLLNHMEQILLAEAHRYVLYHHCCQRLNAI